MFFRVRENSRGMTLVEVLAVIVLIGLIMAVVSRGIFSRGDEAKRKLNEIKMEKLKGSLQQFHLENNTYPESLGELVSQSVADDADTKDIWGYDYLYKTENDRRTYTLSSYGSDGVPGGEGAKRDVTVRP